MAGQCQKLKFNRRRLHMTQNEFAKLVEVDVATIDKLERDEDAWDDLSSDISDRIYAQYRSMASYQPGKEEREAILGVKEKTKQQLTKSRGVKCERLRSKRKEMVMSQKEFAKHVGLSVQTIAKLEVDETAWGVLKQDSVDKLSRCFGETISDIHEPKAGVEKPKRERKKTGNWSDALIVSEDGSVTVDEDYVKEKSEKEESKSDLVEIVDDPKALTPITGSKVEELVSDLYLTNKDRQLMAYIEFACEQLKNSKSHEDFETNIDILTRIIKKQY